MCNPDGELKRTGPLAGPLLVGHALFHLTLIEARDMQKSSGQTPALREASVAAGFSADDLTRMAVRND